MIKRAILQIAFASLFLSRIVCAESEIQLPGSDMSTAQAVKSSTDIVVAKFTNIGGPSAFSFGGCHYNGAELSVLRTLKGRAFEKSPRFTYYVVPGAESPPKTDITYIAVVLLNDGIEKIAPAILKILPATNKNIATVRKLISN
jgi:hypothetical protein